MTATNELFVIVNFPGAFTPVCTKELPGFIRLLPDVNQVGARLIIATPDSVNVIKAWVNIYSETGIDGVEYLSSRRRRSFEIVTGQYDGNIVFEKSRIYYEIVSEEFEREPARYIDIIKSYASLEAKGI